MNKKAGVFLFSLFFIFLSFFIQAQTDNCSSEEVLSVEFPHVIISSVPAEITFHLSESIKNKNKFTFSINNKEIIVEQQNGKATYIKTFNEKETVSISCGSFSKTKAIHPIPLWMSILPPLIAIIMALIFKEVYSALFCGIFSGAFIIFIHAGENIATCTIKSILSVLDTYILYAIINNAHLSIILFSLLIGATVAIISANGGMRGVVNRLSSLATTARNGQLITWFLGLCIFFDDYANTLVVGNTMRPVTDKLKISREKLSYIVDSTAAPVTAIAFVTTWIGAEISYIEGGIQSIGIGENAYNIFLTSLQYAFYPILTIIFIFMLIIRKREFGPMLSAEKKARTNGIKETPGYEESIHIEKDFIQVSNKKPKSINAILPIVIIITGTLAGLMYTGWDNSKLSSAEGFFTKLSIILGNADSYKALLWSSLGGMLLAILLSISQKILSLKQSIDSMTNGFKTMLPAVLILVLAWALASVTTKLHTADFISGIMLQINIAPYLLPAITFIFAALVAFSTGSSWSTMAILYPLMLPASWLLCNEAGYNHAESIQIFCNVVSCVLAGSVLGDHCSPISDTTILSSLASSCKHIEHVRSQLPYALSVGIISVIFGTIPSALGVSPLILFPIAIIILFGIISLFGKKLETK